LCRPDCLERLFCDGAFPAGFRYWWRLLHDGADDNLDNAHLMRMAGILAVVFVLLPKVRTFL